MRPAATRRAYVATPSLAASILAAPGVAALTSLAFSAPASAQAWPAKPVRLVVNFPPGGATDAIAR